MELWPLLALGFSFCGAIIIGYNQWAQMDGRVMAVWKIPGVLLVAVPAFWLLPWPHDPMFYLIAALLGLLLSYADILLMDAAAQHGARLTALYIPIKMLVVFALWCVIEPAAWWAVAAHPWKLVVLGGCAALSFWSLAHIRRCDASWPALLAVAPVAMIFAAEDAGVKGLLGPPTGDVMAMIGGSVAFLTMTCFVGALFGAGWLAWDKTALPRDATTVLKGGVFGLMVMLGVSLLLVTLALAPNPGYVAAITMLSAVWLAIWAHFVKGERNSVVAGIGLVISAMGVALVTSGL